MEATKELSTLIIYVTVVIVLMVGFLVYFFVVYQRRKTSLLVKQAEERKQFEIILAQTQTEIQEQTLKILVGNFMIMLDNYFLWQDAY